MSRGIIIHANHNGAEYDFQKYWDVEIQDPKTKTVYSAFLHNSEFKLRMFEMKLLAKGKLTEQDLDTLHDLHTDVADHNHAMEECD